MCSTTSGTTDHLLQSTSASVQSARPALVLLAPGSAHQPDRQFLLTSTLYQITVVETAREFSLLKATEPFALALLSDTLGRASLVDAARFIRSQWPSARILILGQASSLLEDHLYDEAIPHSSSRQTLSATLGRMSGHESHGRPFILTALTAEHDPMPRRHAGPAKAPCSPERPERMTQLRSGI